ncbi:hypothetical protein WMY93_032434, partial [Mugilogobius chulae]
CDVCLRCDGRRWSFASYLRLDTKCESFYHTCCCLNGRGCPYHLPEEDRNVVIHFVRVRVFFFSTILALSLFSCTPAVAAPDSFLWGSMINTLPLSNQMPTITLYCLINQYNRISFYTTSPGRAQVSYDHEILMMNHVYKERFPKFFLGLCLLSFCTCVFSSLSSLLMSSALPLVVSSPSFPVSFVRLSFFPSSFSGSHVLDLPQVVSVCPSVFLHSLVPPSVFPQVVFFSPSILCPLSLLRFSCPSAFLSFSPCVLCLLCPFTFSPSVFVFEPSSGSLLVSFCLQTFLKLNPSVFCPCILPQVMTFSPPFLCLYVYSLCPSVLVFSPPCPLSSVCPSTLPRLQVLSFSLPRVLSFSPPVLCPSLLSFFPLFSPPLILSSVLLSFLRLCPCVLVSFLTLCPCVSGDGSDGGASVGAVGASVLCSCCRSFSS